MSSPHNVLGVPPSIKTSVGRWTPQEHEIFCHGMRLYPRQWKRIAEVVKTRTAVQIRTHAQKCWKNDNGTAKTQIKVVANNKLHPSSPKAERVRQISCPPALSSPRKKGKILNNSGLSIDTRSSTRAPDHNNAHDMMRAALDSYCNNTLSRTVVKSPVANCIGVRGADVASNANTSPTSIADSDLFNNQHYSSGSPVLYEDMILGSNPTSTEQLEVSCGSGYFQTSTCESSFEMHMPPSSSSFSSSGSSGDEFLSSASSSDDEGQLCYDPLSSELDSAVLLNGTYEDEFLGLLFDEPQDSTSHSAPLNALPVC